MSYFRRLNDSLLGFLAICFKRGSRLFFYGIGMRILLWVF